MAGPECIGAPSWWRNWFFWNFFRGVHSWPVSPSSKGASEALIEYWQLANMRKAQGGELTPHESFYCIYGISAGTTSTFSSRVLGWVWHPALLQVKPNLHRWFSAYSRSSRTTLLNNAVLVGEKMVTSWPIKRLQRVCPWHEEVQLTLKNYPGRQSKTAPQWMQLCQSRNRRPWSPKNTCIEI
jgi:hypothetical protein